MNFSKDKPPVYDKCHELFGVEWDDGITFTYGDTIYCKFDVPLDIIAHENIHIKQQAKVGVNVWWGKYLSDSEFRLSQEVEAYKEQIKFLKKHVKDRNDLARHLDYIWRSMARLYGKMCTYDQARKLTM